MTSSDLRRLSNKHTGLVVSHPHLPVGELLAALFAAADEIDTLRQRVYGDRELWCDVCDNDSRSRAQVEADEHGVPVHICTHGTRQHTAFPSQIRELQQENAGLRGEVADANLRLLSVKQAIEKIVEPEGIDAGVILLSDESPTRWSDEHQCHVYEYENFSPLGDAMVALWKLAAGKSQPETSVV